MADLKLIECPRDAMQGWHDFIPTANKIEYINSLLDCGFDTIDFGSFVSPKAIPQMRDTADVLAKLNLNTSSKLLAIVANERGANDACQFDEIDYFEQQGEIVVISKEGSSPEEIEPTSSIPSDIS